MCAIFHVSRPPMNPSIYSIFWPYFFFLRWISFFNFAIFFLSCDTSERICLFCLCVLFSFSWHSMHSHGVVKISTEHTHTHNLSWFDVKLIAYKLNEREKEQSVINKSLPTDFINNVISQSNIINNDVVDDGGGGCGDNNDKISINGDRIVEDHTNLWESMSFACLPARL